MEIEPATLRGDWRYPTRVRFEPGRIDELPDACESLSVNRPLLVTDPGLCDLPMTEKLLATNQSAGITTTVYSDVKGNPVARNVIEGVAMYREIKCDGVIAFGGGSSIDAAKAIANLADQAVVPAAARLGRYGISPAFAKTWTLTILHHRPG